MKKHFLIAAALLLGAGMAVAGPVGATSPVKLISASTGLMSPVWSPDGSQIAVTTDNYAGIYVANADGTNLRPITTAEGAGYKMKWSADGKSITGRTNVIENHRVMHELCSWNVNSGRVSTIKAKSRNNALPQAENATGVMSIMLNDAARATSQIAVLNEFAGRTVINPALSPDGSKIAFQIVGKGMWMINADGTNLRALGAGSHPTWLPDNATIVYTVVSDNGSQFTASTLYAMDVKTCTSTVLTNENGIIPLSPSVSPDGSKVAFENAADAAIYTVNLKF